MNNPSTFQLKICKGLKTSKDDWPEDWHGIIIGNRLRPIRTAEFDNLDQFTTAAVINLAESITRRSR